jgi:hypothetical protein
MAMGQIVMPNLRRWKWNEYGGAGPLPLQGLAQARVG